MSEDKMMMYITIATLFATLITVMQGWWQNRHDKKKEHENDTAVEDTIRELLRLQSRDVMKMNQSYEELVVDLRNDIMEHLYEINGAVKQIGYHTKQIGEAIAQSSHISSSEHQELREEHITLRRDMNAR